MWETVREIERLTDRQRQRETQRIHQKPVSVGSSNLVLKLSSFFKMFTSLFCKVKNIVILFRSVVLIIL